MDRWGSPPPSSLQRWIARHVRTAQAVFRVVALVCAGLGLTALWSDEKFDAVLPLVLSLSFGTNAWSYETIARRVKEFDKRHSSESGT